jgi:hypothetical protein
MDKISPANNIGCSFDQLEVGAYHIDTKTSGPTKDSISSLSSNDATRTAVVAELTAHIDAQKALWKKEREGLEKQLNTLKEEFAKSPWYVQMGTYLAVEGLKLWYNIQISSLSYLESISPDKILGEMKQEIDKFVTDFEEASKGSPDKKVDNPFDPNAPKITPGFPMITPKNGTTIKGGDGPSLVGTLLDGAGLLVRLSNILIRGLF